LKHGRAAGMQTAIVLQYAAPGRQFLAGEMLPRIACETQPTTLRSRSSSNKKTVVIRGPTRFPPFFGRRATVRNTAKSLRQVGRHTVKIASIEDFAGVVSQRQQDLCEVHLLLQSRVTTASGFITTSMQPSLRSRNFLERSGPSARLARSVTTRTDRSARPRCASTAWEGNAALSSAPCERLGRD